MDDNILSKIEKTDTCWIWKGEVMDSGYGRMSKAYGRKRAHRYVYEHMVGKISFGLHLDHLCRNRICVNPDHLQPVSPRENILRGEGIAAQMARKDVCAKGHPLKGKNLIFHFNTAKRRYYRSCRICKKDTYYRWLNKKKEHVTLSDRQ